MIAKGGLNAASRPQLLPATKTPELRAEGNMQVTGAHAGLVRRPGSNTALRRRIIKEKIVNQHEPGSNTPE